MQIFCIYDRIGIIIINKEIMHMIIGIPKEIKPQENQYL